MENLAQSKTLEIPSQSAMPFHPYSRRPIRSRTYNALVNTLSNWQTLCPNTNVQGNNDTQVRQGFTSGVEFTQSYDENVTCNHDQANLIDELGDRPNYKELVDDPIQETGIDKSKAPELDQINLVTDFLMDNKTDDCGHRDVNGMFGFEMGEFSSIDLLEFDMNFSLHDFSDALNFSFDDDMNVESSKAGDNSEGATSILSENVLRESENRLQLKEMELEKLLSSPCMTDLFGCDDGANKKKRKRGPLTKERKAKKKKKDRILRAEKNRQLGVKRLKLPPPVLKPKTVKHCRHYLQGRCHEGEKCKFSHDVVPATKSKPCSYFARQSCMKGDECPFDHDLSKYPCNNYATKGFCGRGSDCLFSHEIPANRSSPMTPSVSKPEMRESAIVLDDLEPYVKLARPLNNLNSDGKTDNCSIFPKKVDDAKLKSGGNSSGKKVEQVLESVMTAKKTPKGVSFILHGRMPACDPNKQRGDELSPTPGGNADVQKTYLNGLLSTNKSNKVSVVEAQRKPQGINFLSFAQTTSLDDSSCKTLSNLFSSGYDGKEKQSYVSSEGGKIIEASTQVSENVTELSEKRSNNVFLVNVPLPVNNLTTGKTQLHASVNEKICSFLRTSPLSNTPSSVRKAVQSTLAFAAKFESSIQPGHSLNS